MTKDTPRKIRDERPPSRGTQRFLWIFSVVMVLIAGSAFIFKLIEFFLTATREGPAAMGSFLIPVLNYLLVAAGFLLVRNWRSPVVWGLLIAFFIVGIIIIPGVSKFVGCRNCLIKDKCPWMT